MKIHPCHHLSLPIFHPLEYGHSKNSTTFAVKCGMYTSGAVLISSPPDLQAKENKQASEQICSMESLDLLSWLHFALLLLLLLVQTSKDLLLLTWKDPSTQIEVDTQDLHLCPS